MVICLTRTPDSFYSTYALHDDTISSIARRTDSPKEIVWAREIGDFGCPNRGSSQETAALAWLRQRQCQGRFSTGTR